MKGKLFLIVVFFCTQALGQKFEEFKSLSLDFQVSTYSTDPFGTVYLGGQNGELLVLDSLGGIRQTFLLPAKGPIHRISALNPLRVFVFSRNTQSFWLIERFTADPRVYSTESYSDTYVQDMVPGSDHSFWLVESQGNMIRKVNESTLITLFNQSLLYLEIGQIDEIYSYKNVVILLHDETEITLLDNYGNRIKRISGEAISALQLWEDRLMYMNGDQLIAIPVYEKKPGTSNYDVPGNYQNFVRVNDEIFLFIQKNTVDFYRYIDR